MDTKNITAEQAVELAESKFYEDMTPEEIVKFQLFEDKLCMPFSVFHEALEKALGRPVWTHELAYPGTIRSEFLGELPPPTFEDIVALIPEEKRIIVEVSP